MIPNPNQIFERYERGEIEREEMQALMALHARELISEMEEDHSNPAAALLEYLLSKRATSRLVRKHGGRLIREIFHALSVVPDFPPARILWNAMHPDVPLHCFLRIRREPVFRLTAVERKGDKVEVEVQHGAAAKGKAEVRKFTLARSTDWILRVVE